MVPDSHKDLLEGPVFSVLTTISPDGEPENTVIWASWDGEHVLVNTARGRRKASNIKENPNVALMAIDPDNPYRWIDVRGVVDAVVEDTNYDNINQHAKIYAGADEYYGGVAPAKNKGTEERIILKIKPENVVTQG
jgi:PPOX class probable F420-dependent enzyme